MKDLAGPGLSMEKNIAMQKHCVFVKKTVAYTVGVPRDPAHVLGFQWFTLIIRISSVIQSHQLFATIATFYSKMLFIVPNKNKTIQIWMYIDTYLTLLL